jgi:flagellar basal-body rod modification protein FlgD
MPDPIVGNVNTIINSKTPENNEKSKTLGKDDFLKILITQLKYQDPSQPMQDKEFIAQMAQFTSVEQLSNMASEMNLLRQSLGITSDLIGKTVSWRSTDDAGNSIEKTGKVDSITFKDGNQFINVNGEALSVNQLTKIEQAGGTQ